MSRERETSGSAANHRTPAIAGRRSAKPGHSASVRVSLTAAVRCSLMSLTRIEAGSTAISWADAPIPPALGPSSASTRKVAAASSYSTSVLVTDVGMSRRTRWRNVVAISVGPSAPE